MINLTALFQLHSETMTAPVACSISVEGSNLAEWYISLPSVKADGYSYTKY